MVTAQQVAEAAVGAIEHGTHRTGYAISGINMKFKEFNEVIAELLGQDMSILQYKEYVVKAEMIETLKRCIEG